MTYQLPSNETSGLDGLLTYVAGQIPFFFPTLLFFIFILIAFAGHLTQQARIGRGNLPMWMSISSFITTSGAIILHFIPNLIDVEFVIISIAFTSLFTIWFLASSRE